MVGFYPTFSVLGRAVFLVFSIVWIGWYLKRLPSDIKDLKGKYSKYRERFQPEVLAHMESEERKRHYQENCSLEWWSDLFVRALLWIVTLFVMIFLFSFLAKLIPPVVRSFRKF